MRIKNWLEQQLQGGGPKKLLFWINQSRNEIAIKWKHASYNDYNPADSYLFKQWAQHSNRIGAGDSASELKRWKTNFRCALHSATNIKFIGSYKSHNINYRKYRLLEKPDPQKVKEKRKSNKKATKSKLKPKEQRRHYYSRKSTVKPKTEPKITKPKIKVDYSESYCGVYTHYEEEDDTRPSLVQCFDEEPSDYGSGSDSDTASYNNSIDSQVDGESDCSDFVDIGFDETDYGFATVPLHYMVSEQILWGNTVKSVEVGENVTTEQLVYENL